MSVLTPCRASQHFPGNISVLTSIARTYPKGLKCWSVLGWLPILHGPRVLSPLFGFICADLPTSDGEIRNLHFSKGQQCRYCKSNGSLILLYPCKQLLFCALGISDVRFARMTCTKSAFRIKVAYPQGQHGQCSYDCIEEECYYRVILTKASAKGYCWWKVCCSIGSCLCRISSCRGNFVCPGDVGVEDKWGQNTHSWQKLLFDSLQLSLLF